MTANFCIEKGKVRRGHFHLDINPTENSCKGNRNFSLGNEWGRRTEKYAFTTLFRPIRSPATQTEKVLTSFSAEESESMDALSL